MMSCLRCRRARQPGRAGLATLALMWAGTAPMWTGCMASNVATPALHAPLRPAVALADVVPGQALIVPVLVEDAVRAQATTRIRLDDGRLLPARLHRVVIHEGRPDHDSPAGRWLDLPPRWTVEPPAPPDTTTSSRPRPAAEHEPAGVRTLALLTADPPLDALGQGVWLGATRVAVRWIPDPAAAEEHGAPIQWQAPTVSDPLLRSLADEERRHPVRRWRYRLLTLGPPGLSWGMEGQPPPIAAEDSLEPFDDPLLEKIARGIEAQWAAGLNWLWLADADLAERIRRRLVATVEIEPGQRVPAWPTEGPDLDALRADLINLRLKGVQRAERARVWLEAQPPAVAWVVDDAGLRTPEGHTLATLAVANLTERATLAWADPPDGARPTLTPVPSLAMVTLTVPEPSPRDGPAGAAAIPPRHGMAHAPLDDMVIPVRVHAGRWSATLAVILRAVPARPPGLTIGPLQGQWTMERWLAGQPPEPADWPWLTGGHLAWRSGAGPALEAPAQGHRESDQTPAPPAEGWWLYLECKSPAGPDGLSPARRETIQVWTGPMGQSLWTVTISSDGTVQVLPGRNRPDIPDRTDHPPHEPSPPPGVVVHRRGDRWVCHVLIPPEALTDAGTLTLAIERRDAMGRRWTWPRPVFPWQPEPGRIRIDLSRWHAPP